MKMTGMSIIAGAVMAQVCYADRVTDIFKPDYQQQERIVYEVLEYCAKHGLKYKIKERGEIVFPGERHRTPPGLERFHYDVTLPPAILKKLEGVNSNLVNDVADAFLDDERFSFYAMVIIAGVNTTDLFGTLKNLAIAKQDKQGWDANLTNSVMTFALRPRGYYREMVLNESTPANHVILIPEFDKDDVNPWSNPLISRFSESKSESHQKYISDNKDRPAPWSNPVSWTMWSKPTIERLHAAPFKNENIKIWLSFCLYDNIFKRSGNIHEFITWCRKNDPATKPYLPALMMGLFTVDGYAFDDGTGVYTMNERGRMLMDFIAEFPIPENATRVQAVMDGGNKDEIEGMMKKHGTEGKWKELLKNSAHPEFAKYPQD
ncbi:MAG: hypothetical protein FWG50_13540 [Kiritimatiellaeota bacterium]|nr:hypothetical protein [Kiritimatiellota bacterium]